MGEGPRGASRARGARGATGAWLPHGEVGCPTGGVVLLGGMENLGIGDWKARDGGGRTDLSELARELRE